MASSKTYSDSDMGGAKKRPKLELASAYGIIWLDSHICQEKECKQLKIDFQMTIVEAAAVPPLIRDPAIDGMICQIRECGRAVTFVKNEDAALEEIDKQSKFRKIIFVTSGRLGKVVIPRILEEELKVYMYYIFCGAMIDHIDWIMDYIDNGFKIVALDFEIDLLIRLGRDMCREFIDEGTRLLNTGYAAVALKYFEYAEAFGKRAYDLDKPKDANDKHQPSTEHVRILCGDNGLIAQARRLVGQR